MVPDSIKQQLNLLINLAACDQIIGEHEEKLIYQIASANGVGREVVAEMMTKPQSVSDFSSLTDEQRFEHLFHLIQLMKVDGKVLKSEIDFCEKTAVALGYTRGVVAAISAYVYSSPNVNADRGALETLSKRFLKKDH